MPSVASNSNSPSKILIEYLEVRQKQRHFRLVRMSAADLVEITYVAARGVSKEQGAVQRILSPRRIASLKEYAIKGGDYPACIVLNWTNSEIPLAVEQGKLRIPMVPDSAQIIDGQHRVAGLREALAEDESVGAVQIPVAIYELLGTRACADIFLSINTEQKPVPRSLVYDLYGLASEYIVDFAASRAKDLATELNERDLSPYKGMIKFPGDAISKGGVALSTVVSAIKPFVAEKGIFEQAGIVSLEQQSSVLINYFAAIKAACGETWADRDNAFNYAAGFSGAVDFLKSHLFDYCVRRESFETETIADCIGLSADNRILQSEIKGLGGAKARQFVAERMVEAFEPDARHSKEFKF